MYDFSSFFSLKHFESSFGILKSRFPLGSGIIAILTGVFFYQVNSESESVLLTSMILTGIVVFFFSVGMSLFLETRKSIMITRLLPIVPLVYGVFFFMTVNPAAVWTYESFTFFLLHLTVFLSFLFFAPYIKHIFDNEDENIEYTNYFSRVAWAILMAMIVGGSLMALGAIAIASVEALFDIHTFLEVDKLYGNWAVIALSLVAPLYGLVSLPEKGNLDKKKYEINKFFSFLIRYLAVPFIYIYFAILYAYSIRVLLNFSDWPRGIISWMVIGFSIFGYITYIFSKPYEGDNRLVDIFRSYFPALVIPQIGMLGYAIWLRISQYDLTMDRYFGVIFGVWLLGISIYLVASKAKSLSLIMASLASLALIISIGPWSVYSLPLERQYDRLLVNLEKAEILQNGNIVPLTKSLDMTLENDIYSGIEYVCKFSECEYIKTLFADELKTPLLEDENNWNEYQYNKDKDYPGMTAWDITYAVTKAIGVSFRYDNGSGDLTEGKYISFLSKDLYYNEDAIFPIEVSGYDRILWIYGADYSGRKPPSRYISIDPNTSKLTIHEGTGSTIFSLSEFDMNLTDRYKNAENNSVPDENLTWEFSSGSTEIRLVLQKYATLNPAYSGTGGIEYYTISGYALIRDAR